MTGFEQWAAFHAATFGMTGDSADEAFAAWRESFEVAGYTDQELRSATKAMATSGENYRWRNDHLSAIVSHIRRQRIEDVRPVSADDEEADRGRCETCLGTGRAIVPHPRYVVDGRWIFRGTCRPAVAVLCFCIRGRYQATSQEEKKVKNKQMSLPEYERRFSREFWKMLVDADRAETEAAAKARAATRSQDKDKGQLFGAVGNVLQRLKTLGE